MSYIRFTKFCKECKGILLWSGQTLHCSNRECPYCTKPHPKKRVRVQTRA